MLPNLITLLALCAGLTAIRLAVEDKLDWALAAIVFAALLDGVDGRLHGLDGRLDGLDAKIDSVAAETRLHFDITAAGLRRDMAAVIEGMANVDERLTREANDIRSEMRDRFADTDALIKYAYTKLDRRLGILEESVQ